MLHLQWGHGNHPFVAFSAYDSSPFDRLRLSRGRIVINGITSTISITLFPFILGRKIANCVYLSFFFPLLYEIPIPQRLIEHIRAGMQSIDYYSGVLNCILVGFAGK